MSMLSTTLHGKAMIGISMMLLSYSNTLTTVNAAKFFTYEAETLVTDHAAIDMDFRDILYEMSKGTADSFERARNIYKSGGHSKSYASVSLQSPLTQEMKEGTKLMGLNVDGRRVKGNLLKNAHVGDDILWFMYNVEDEVGDHSGCQVGSRDNPRPLLTGCLAESGVLQNVEYRDNGVGREERLVTNFTYTYEMMDDNRAGRQIEKFSLSADAKMLQCRKGCPQVDFKKVNDYYGRYDFGDEFIKSAFDERATELDRGNENFALVSGAGKGEAIELAILLMNIKSFMIRGMETSLASCKLDCGKDGKECRAEHIHGWDQAVAFYTGSLEEGSENESSSDDEALGFMLYNFADRQCAKYGTCGYDGKGTDGTALVNYRIFRLFEQGKQYIMSGKCAKARARKEEIVQIMMIPAIQSLLRVAHKLNHEGVDPKRRIVAKGAALAAAVAPIVHTCNPYDAKEIYENMKIDKSPNSDGVQRLTSYAEVRNVLERNYACLGITCEDIGGLVNTDSENEYYFEGADPCMMEDGVVIPHHEHVHSADSLKVSKPEKWSKPRTSSILITIITSVCVSAITFCVLRSKFPGQNEKEYEGRNVDEDVDVRYRDDMRFQGEDVGDDIDPDAISY